MAIAHLIREARERAGLTRAELARRPGVAASTVGRIETGARAPSTDLAERLVRAAGFEIRIALGEPDSATDALFERTLRRTPAERLADATRAARFVLRGRRALAMEADEDWFADRRSAPARRNGDGFSTIVRSGTG